VRRSIRKILKGILAAVFVGVLAVAIFAHEKIVWQWASYFHTVRSYGIYISLYPHGQSAGDSNVRIAALRADQSLYEAAIKIGNESALRAFLSSYPGHLKEGDAQQALKDIAEGADIIDLLGRKAVEADIDGARIQAVRLHIHKLLPYHLLVRIPAGTYFVSSNSSIQNMVATSDQKFLLARDRQESYSVPAACASMRKKVPNNSKLIVQRSPNPELTRLMPALEKAHASFSVQQAAVWIVTDDADYKDLGSLISAPLIIPGITKSRGIDERDAIRAMQICDSAGIDITKKAIWRDWNMLYDALSVAPKVNRIPSSDQPNDQEIRRWLESKKK
jgi:hypothetical protein